MSEPNLAVALALLASHDAPAMTHVVSGPLALARATRNNRAAPGWQRRAVHPLRPPRYQPGWRTALRDAWQAQALVELAPAGPLPARRIDELLARHGAQLQGPLRCGFGTVTAPAVSTAGASLFFRAGPGAVAEAAALTRLAEGDTPHVPTCVAADVNDDFAWVLETNVPGRPTARLTQELVRGAATFLAGLPRVSQPSSWSADVDTVQHVAPQHERALEAVRAQLTRASADLPGVGRHGDFWAGNLLTRAGRLSGVVDWDAWQPSGFPGTDLLHLIATRERHARRVSLGAVFLHEPWSDDEYERSAEAYWRALDVHPTRPVLTAVGIAWWLGQVAGDLRRSPAFATDPMWMHTNVDAVVASRVLSG